MLISVFGDESVLNIVKESVKNIWDSIDKYSVSKDVYLEKFTAISLDYEFLELDNTI